MRFLFFVVAITCLGQSADAQTAPERGSRLLSTNHWSYEYIARLRAAGRLANLNPLVQPYRRMDVARGLAEMDDDQLSAPMEHWVRLLRTEFANELQRLVGQRGNQWGLHASTGGVASTSQRLDPARPLGDGDVWSQQRYGAWVEQGALAADVQLRWNSWLEADPDGLHAGQGKLGRTDPAYVSITGANASLTFGRLRQNWGYVGTPGLMISDYATAYPQVSFAFTLGRVTLRSLVGELETMTQTSGSTYKRYITAHRLDYATDNLVLSVGESILFGSMSGVHLRYLNPLEVLFTTRSDAPVDALENVALDAQFWYRPGNVEFRGEFFLDDVDINPGARDAEPFTYAFLIGARIVDVFSRFSLAAQYEQVSAFAYRTPNEVDVWSFLGRGLGANFSDYDRLTLEADYYTPVPGLDLTPKLVVQRQGEGNLRDPVPPLDVHLASPALFLGVRETTLRAALAGRYQPNLFLTFDWDVGYNTATNSLHQSGVDATGWEAVVSARLTLDWPFQRR